MEKLLLPHRMNRNDIQLMLWLWHTVPDKIVYRAVRTIPNQLLCICLLPIGL
ncbi:hypothetical protein EVA_01987 [gut metagenome]|uniref:Uncharacterized protein n=1 Tax=gut metagenome TaxID=749906 RepID=J9DAJ0_9ZZZZ